MGSLEESVKKDEQMKKLTKILLVVLISLFAFLFVIFPFIYSVCVLKTGYHPIKSIKPSLTLNGKLFKSQAEKDKERWLMQTEAYVAKIFPRIELKKQRADGTGSYCFYISPDVWSQLSTAQKDVIYQKCIMYVYLKINPKDKLVPKQCTKIVSSRDGEILAETVKCVPTYR